MKESPKIQEKALAWIVYHGIKTSSGEKFEFDNHRFMLDPISDLSSLQTHRKCAQIGFSESMICKALYLTREAELNICYTMPSKSDMDDFHLTKFGGIVRANPYLQQFTDGNSSKKVIQTVNNKERYIHLVGAYNSESSSNKENTTKGISFTSDINIYDESDRSDTYILDQLQSRMDNSNYAYTWMFSNPTYANVGTDEKYQESDQLHWITKCSKCGYRQYMDWFKLSVHTFTKGTNHCFIDDERKMFICGGCAKELDFEDRKRGEWVAKQKSLNGWRGYWYSQMMYVHHTAEMLLQKEQDRSPSVFSNMVLGKPYISGSVAINYNIILNNFKSRPENPVYGQVGMGIDVRIDELQYVLRDKHGMFEYGRTKDWGVIERIIAKYGATFVIDLHPQTGEAKRLVKKHIGKGWYAIFKPETDQSELVRFGSKTDLQMCLIKREDMFDVITDKYITGNSTHNITPTTLKEFADEWGNLVRTIEVDSRGNDRPIWVKTNANQCDFPFADLYSQVAMMRVATGRATVSKYSLSKPNTGSLAPDLTPADIIKSFTNKKK